MSLWWVFGGGTSLVVTGQPTVSPTVHLYPPSQEELKNGGKATLVCLADGFYPHAIDINWLVDGKDFSSGVEKAQPTKQGDKYLTSSYLTLNKADWDSHDTYTCKVAHGSKNFEKVVKRFECC